MKRLLIVIFSLLGFAVYAQTPPTVVTGPIVTVSTNSATMTGYVNPNGANVAGWFYYGLNPNYLQFTGTATPPVDLGSGSASVLAGAVVSNLLGGAVYYYTCAASNSAGPVTIGDVSSFVASSGGYTYGGDKLQSLDPTHPYDSEPGSVLGAVARQERAALIGWANVEHNLNGTHKAGFVGTAYLANSAVTWGKLDPTLQAAISLNGTNNIYALVTNAVTYITSQEYPTPTLTHVTSVGAVQIGSLYAATTNFSKVKVECEILCNNSATVNRYISLTYTTNGYVSASFCCIEIGPGLGQIVPFSYLFYTHGATAVNISVMGNSDATADSPMNATLQTFRAFGIP